MTSGPAGTLMNESYARAYRRLWERHWWWRARAAWLRDWVETLAAGRRDLRILDAGCGDGLFFSDLAQFGVVQGLEPDARLLTDGPHRSAIRVGRLDAAFHPEPTYDLVLLLDVLEHCPDDAEALAAVRRALRPGGRLLLTVPGLPWLWSAHDTVNGHYRRYTRCTLHAALGGAGLEVEDMRWFFAWTIGPLVLRRWLRPTDAATTEAMVRVPPRPINALFRTLSQIDLALARRVRWPLGSSLLAIARRPHEP
jgi:SAM-dependent methyltransferase